MICDCPGLRRETAIPVAVADIQADAIGPFDGVVFDDPVIAAGDRDHAVLRKRVSVAGMLEGDSLDADEGKPLLHGDEGLLAGGDFDQVIGGRAGGQRGCESRFPSFQPRTGHPASRQPPA